MLWAIVTIGAAAAQIARNVLQSGLTGTVGTPGATMVRFVFAIPFAFIAYSIAVWGLGRPIPATAPGLIEWTLAGSLAQVAATALMLKAMHVRGFAVAYAYIKTEPVLLALGGWWLLGDALPGLAWAGILIATAGVLWASLPQGNGFAGLRGEVRPMVIGILGGGLFGLSSLAFRGAILTLAGVEPWMAALHVMVLALLMQSVLLLGWLWFADRQAITATFAAWKPSIGAGFTGMVATLLWFTGFALTAAANVRTLGLIEMPLAALLNRRVSGRRLTKREWTGVALVTFGIAALLRSTI